MMPCFGAALAIYISCMVLIVLVLDMCHDVHTLVWNTDDINTTWHDFVKNKMLSLRKAIITRLYIVTLFFQIVDSWKSMKNVIAAYESIRLPV